MKPWQYRIWELYKDGYSLEAIAKMRLCGRRQVDQTVRKQLALLGEQEREVLKTNKIERRDRQPLSPELNRIADLLTRANDCDHTRRIQSYFGCTQLLASGMLQGIEDLNFTYLKEIADLFGVTVTQLLHPEVQKRVDISRARARLLLNSQDIQRKKTAQGAA